MPFIRVKDSATGHEFDVLDTHPRIGEALKPIKPVQYPPSPKPRPPKHYRPKGPRIDRATTAPTELPDTGPGDGPSRPAGHTETPDEEEQS